MLVYVFKECLRQGDNLRNPHATLTALMTTVATRFGFLHEQRVALFAAPPDPHSGLAPNTFRPLVGGETFCIGLGVRARNVTRIAIGPFLLLGRVTGTLGATGVLAMGADGSSSRDEKVLALVAVPADTLLRRTTLKVGTTGTALDGQILLLLGRLGSNLRSGRGNGGGGGGSSSLTLLLGRVARTLLATSVLALLANTVRSKGGLATVALAVDTHTDGLLHTLDVLIGSAGSNPFVRFKGQAVFGEESTSTLLLSSTAWIADLTRGRCDGLRLRLGLGGAGDDGQHHGRGHVN